MSATGNIDMELWHRVQRIAYPDRSPSHYAPYPVEEIGTTPKRTPASWLYHQLANDADLRAKVLP